MKKLIYSLCQVHGCLFILALFFYSNVSLGFQIPTSLSLIEGKSLANSFGMQNIHRMNGPANSIGIFPGVYPGIEFLMIFPPNVQNLGAGNGQLTSFMPVPRIFVTKGLPFNIDINAHFLPAFVVPAYHGWGANVKWNILPEIIAFASVAVKISYDYSEFISNAVKSSNFTFDAIISQDLVIFLPYGGVGMIYSSNTIEGAFMATGLKTAFSTFGIHVFGGAQIKTPITFNIEVGLAGSSFYAGLPLVKISLMICQHPNSTRRSSRWKA